jgi:DNA-binding transcriptional MerR regulator
MADLDIGEVARRAGLTPATLRFYERKGLIASNGRRGLRRQYPPSVVDRLALVALGQAAGFPLDDVARMFGTDGRPRIDRAMLARKAAEVDRTVRRLIAMRNGLRHAARCPAREHMECPTFQRLLRDAISGKLKGASVRRSRLSSPPSGSARHPA